jgi:[ribosomal protein S5]-alanine N-acetyltransferase
MFMLVLETERLSLSRLDADDAEFILELLTQPSFLQFIGDRGVRNLETSRGYIENVNASYARFGFGLYRVVLKATGESVGMCGLLKRDSLDDVDIGYAMLERHWGQGYAYEAAAAVISYGMHVLKLPRIVAITAPDNIASINLLEKLGLRFEKMVHLPGHDGESRLFVPQG